MIIDTPQTDIEKGSQLTVLWKYKGEEGRKGSLFVQERDENDEATNGDFKDVVLSDQKAKVKVNFGPGQFSLLLRDNDGINEDSFSGDFNVVKKSRKKDNNSKSKTVATQTSISNTQL